MRILQVFNRYLHPGGEEKSVERICRHLSERHEVSRCLFDSKEWQGPTAPSTLSQAMRLFYNPAAKERFDQIADQSDPQIILTHNLYPVASPAIYHAAKQRQIPVIQYLHNFRPFSVGGTLYSRGRILDDALHGNFGPELREGAWQGSVIKSALFATMLQMLYASGWLQNVRTWIAISDFMRDQLINAGAVPPDRIFTLRHSWDARPMAPDVSDQGTYLFLGRLVEEKGIATLCQAWDLLRSKLGAATPFLHIAGEGPLLPLVQSHAASNPSIRMLGLIDGQQKIRELTDCRALIAPSTWWEPLGIVVYEAFDYAKPVLAASSGGLTETVAPGTTGFLHEAGNAESLMQDVLKLESMSTDARADMGKKGREWLLRETSILAWQERFDHILQNTHIAPP